MIAFIDPAGRHRHIDDNALLIVDGGVLLVAGSGRLLAAVGGKKGLGIRCAGFGAGVPIFLPHPAAVAAREAGETYVGADQRRIDVDRFAVDQPSLDALPHRALKKPLEKLLTPALPNPGQATVVW